MASDTQENGIKILQISPTYGKPCGVGNFSANLHREMLGAGLEVRTQDSFAGTDFGEIVLLQHEWSTVDTESVKAFCARSSRPVVIFGHTAEISGFDDVAAGYIVMNKRVAEKTRRPSLTVSHPGYAVPTLSPRLQLREHLGLPTDRPIVGSCGFLLEARRFNWFADHLLDQATERCFHVCLMAPAHERTPFHLRNALQGLAECFPNHFTYIGDFLRPPDLNQYMQACDLLWCWTEIDGQAYSSGVASDMYGSGTRMVLADKEQHRTVLGLQNVVSAPADRWRFLEALLGEIGSGQFPRHDPSPVSWRTTVGEVSTFLSQVLCGKHSSSGEREDNSSHARCRLLKSREEVSGAHQLVRRSGLIHHHDSIKDWDLSQIVPELDHGDILDMGAYGSFVLPNIVKRGLGGRKVGIDLRKAPDLDGVELLVGDLTKTPFSAHSFDTLTCLSVIEHGVDFAAFASEAARLLRPGGRLYVTFDYWEPKIVTGHGPAWEILDRRQVETLIRELESRRLLLLEPFDWSLDEKVVSHAGHEYTFGIIVCRMS